MRAIALALALPIVLAGCVTDRMTPEESLADAIGPRIAGEARNCVSTSLLDNARIVDNRTIVYRRSGTIYVNTLPFSCPGLRPSTTLITHVQGGQLCRNDSISTLDAGASIPGPRCQLGQFTPYTLPR